MRKILLIIIIASTSLLAQSAGNSGLSFLKLGFGARNMAMGDAGAAASKDVTSLFYNPANLSESSGNQIMLMHNEWIQGVRSEVLGAKTDIYGVPFALGINVTSINDIPIRTQPTTEPIASFNAEYFFGSISTGFHVVDNISFGATIKYLYEGLYVDEATGWGFDFGLNYKTPIDGLRAVAVVRNLGSMNQLRNQDTKLPTEIRIGPNYQFQLPGNKIAVDIAAEFLKYTPTNDSHFNLGAEITYDNMIALRGGYQSNYISKSFTAGLGIMWGNLDFDYAFTPFQYGLGTGNTVSLSFKF